MRELKINIVMKTSNDVKIENVIGRYDLTCSGTVVLSES
jgi:hypothetical protein